MTVVIDPFFLWMAGDDEALKYFDRKNCMISSINQTLTHGPQMKRRAFIQSRTSSHSLRGFMAHRLTHFPAIQHCRDHLDSTGTSGTNTRYGQQPCRLEPGIRVWTDASAGRALSTMSFVPGAMHRDSFSNSLPILFSGLISTFH